VPGSHNTARFGFVRELNMTSILTCSLRLWAFFLLVFTGVMAAEKPTSRQILYDLVLNESDESEERLLNDLSQTGDPFIKVFVKAWRTGEVYSVDRVGHGPVIVQRVSEQYRLLINNNLADLSEEEEAGLSKVRPSRGLRRSLKWITDTIDLSSPKASVRIDAALKLGLSRKDLYLPDLERQFEIEENLSVKRVIEEAILINKLENPQANSAVIEAVTRLGDLKSLTARDAIQDISNKAEDEENTALAQAGRQALRKIEKHQYVVEKWGNLFRGLSLGSVLLMVAFGLAITFGLMGIINMAHGEFIAIGGYTCYMVQNAFASAFGVQSTAYQWFFLVSLPVSFVVAAVIGLGCERTFIRFLYRRPLESLLATWGLSMVLQQTFRLIFGAANVQVNTPELFLGNLSISGVSMSYTRLFVIGFAGVIVVATWLLLTKTKLGLYIRAVMQNRQMAASMGIPVTRVNALTFSFGCGLASLAGAALSQIGNVGPSMGQTYLVDSFMVVVSGSVGNLLGAGISAMGIGVVDQFLQPTLGPVMGKITVFTIIILFLQWKPGGLFPTKSRSLED
jgi:urea transport system permease protein